MLWNVCTCLGCSKHFLSLFPIHTLLVHASHWRLQSITLHASKITIKIFLQEVELHNSSWYELCSTTCVVTLILFTFTHSMNLLTGWLLPSHKYLAELCQSEKWNPWDGAWTGSLSAHYRLPVIKLPCHFQGLWIPSTQHSSWETSPLQIIASCSSEWVQNRHLLLPCPLLPLVYVLIGENLVWESHLSTWSYINS